MVLRHHNNLWRTLLQLLFLVHVLCHYCGLGVVFVVVVVRLVPVMGVVAAAPQEEVSTTSSEASAAEECVINLDGTCQNTEETVATGTIHDDGDKSKQQTLQTTLGLEVDEEDEEEEEEEDELGEVWYTGTAPQIGKHLKCPWNDEDDNSDSSLVEMHTDETWKTFNEVYHQVVDRTRSSLPPTFEGSGFQVPVEIKYMKSIGRGVFAKEVISRGQLIWKAVNTAEFTKAQDYRDFLRKLPQNLACDVLIWAYVRMISRKQQRTFKVCADLDEGSFVNHSNHPQMANMELGIGRLLRDDEDEEITWYGCDLEFYANRDIAAGEEIRANYDDFVERHGWKKMGL